MQELDELKKQHRTDAIWLDKDILIDLYYNQKHGTPYISKVLNVSLKTVTNNFKRYDLKFRSKAEQMQIIVNNYWKLKIDPVVVTNLIVNKGYTRKQLEQYFHCSKEPIEKIMQELNLKFSDNHKFRGTEQYEQIKHQLKILFFEKKLTKKAICKQLNISYQTLTNYCSLLKIDGFAGWEYRKKKVNLQILQDLVVNKGYKMRELTSFFKCNKHIIRKVMQENNIKFPKRLNLYRGTEKESEIKNQLEYLLFEKNLTKKQICDIFNIGYSTLNHYMVELGLINVRYTITGRSTGDPKYYKWSLLIRKKYNYKCNICGATKKLCAHHIKSYKNYPELRYDINNGILLCHSCHMAAHRGELEFSIALKY